MVLVIPTTGTTGHYQYHLQRLHHHLSHCFILGCLPVMTMTSMDVMSRATIVMVLHSIWQWLHSSWWPHTIDIDINDPCRPTSDAYRCGKSLDGLGLCVIRVNWMQQPLGIVIPRDKGLNPTNLDKRYEIWLHSLSFMLFVLSSTLQYP